MRNKDNELADTRSADATTTQCSVYRKYTLNLDCEGLLKPAPGRQNTYTAKSAEESVSFFQLDSVIACAELDRMKLKCFHTCAPLNVERDACVDALWSIGELLKAKYAALGSSVYCEHLTDGSGTDWSEPDATLMLIIS